MGFRYLWSPLRLGPVTVRTGSSSTAHLTNYATQDGHPSEQHTACYEARAAGGAGLIITEEHSTHPTDWPYEKLIHGFHRDVIPGYRRITEAVHRHRVPIFAQINHNGGQASSLYSRRPVWAPSPVADPLFREVPKAIDLAEIGEVVDGYALVAGHCAEGGFDGIELQCSHSSLVRGFLFTSHQPPHRRLRGRPREPGSPPARDRDCRAPDHRYLPRPRRPALWRRADRRWNHARRGRRGGSDDRRDRSRRLHQHLDRGGDGVALHDRGVDACSAWIHACSSRPRSGRRSNCPWSVWGDSRTRSKPNGPWPRATAIWWAWSEARSPTRTSRPRHAPVLPKQSGCASRATKSASAGWA